MDVNKFSHIQQNFFLGTDLPLDQWKNLFDGEPPALLTAEERDEWVKKMDKVALASDAFFPFRDNIDRAVQVIISADRTTYKYHYNNNNNYSPSSDNIHIF